VDGRNKSGHDEKMDQLQDRPMEKRNVAEKANTHSQIKVGAHRQQSQAAR
jgi:hypothetical protein